MSNRNIFQTFKVIQKRIMTDKDPELSLVPKNSQTAASDSEPETQTSGPVALNQDINLTPNP